MFIVSTPSFTAVDPLLVQEFEKQGDLLIIEHEETYVKVTVKTMALESGDGSRTSLYIPRQNRRRLPCQSSSTDKLAPKESLVGGLWRPLYFQDEDNSTGWVTILRVTRDFANSVRDLSPLCIRCWLHFVGNFSGLLDAQFRQTTIFTQRRCQYGVDPFFLLPSSMHYSAAYQLVLWSIPVGKVFLATLRAAKLDENIPQSAR